MSKQYRMNAAAETPAPDGQSELELLEEVALEEPRMYQVLLHNDDYTTMEFVIQILMEVFRKSADQATNIMLAVHKRGVGIAGVYLLEIAETKVEIVRQRAQEAGYPLRCTLQEVRS